MLFHSGASTSARYDESYSPLLNTWDNYDIITEAVGRGWYVVMHDGGLTTNCHGYSTYGNELFQRHTEAVIADVLDRHKINREKIYGYGFSSGAGEALAYAARHRDPKSDAGYFAAVISSSGHLSPALNGAVRNNGNGYILQCILGAEYCENTFFWQRASILDAHIDQHYAVPASCSHTETPVVPLTTAEIDYWVSQAHNIGFLPVKMFYTHSEVNRLVTINQLYNAWLNLHYEDIMDRVDVFDCSAGSQCNSTSPDCDPPGSNHQWDMVCAYDALEFLKGNTRKGHLRNLDHGVLLCAESERRYDHFTPTLTSIAGNGDVTDFGRIVWSIPADNEVAFTEADMIGGSAARHHNLGAIRIHTDHFTPFDTASGIFTIHTTYNDISSALPIQVVVEGYPASPTILVTDGNGSPMSFTNFTWDADAETIAFDAPPGDFTWAIAAP